MNREEQVIAAAKEYALENTSMGCSLESAVRAFIAGVFWADSHPKEDGVEILKQKILTTINEAHNEENHNERWSESFETYYSAIRIIEELVKE